MLFILNIGENKRNLHLTSFKPTTKHIFIYLFIYIYLLLALTLYLASFQQRVVFKGSWELTENSKTEHTKKTLLMYTDILSVEETKIILLVSRHLPLMTKDE